MGAATAATERERARVAAAVARATVRVTRARCAVVTGSDALTRATAPEASWLVAAADLVPATHARLRIDARADAAATVSRAAEVRLTTVGHEASLVAPARGCRAGVEALPHAAFARTAHEPAGTVGRLVAARLARVRIRTPAAFQRRSEHARAALPRTATGLDVRTAPLVPAPNLARIRNGAVRHGGIFCCGARGRARSIVWRRGHDRASRPWRRGHVALRVTRRREHDSEQRADASPSPMASRWGEGHAPMLPKSPSLGSTHPAGCSRALPAALCHRHARGVLLARHACLDPSLGVAGGIGRLRMRWLDEHG